MNENNYLVVGEIKSSFFENVPFYVKDGAVITFDIERATKYTLDEAMKISRVLNRIPANTHYTVLRYEYAFEKYEKEKDV